jgi:hypothetical protein
MRGLDTALEGRFIYVPGSILMSMDRMKEW